MSIRTFLLSLFTLLLLTTSRAVYAQAVANAEIHGTVQDSSGAVVSGAQVKATQTDTGYTQTTVSGADGLYSLPNLPVGPYKFDVTSQAFKSYTQSGIVLQVGNNVQINVPLEVGSRSEERRVG